MASVQENTTSNDLYPTLDQHQLHAQPTVHKTGHRRNGSSVTAASIKAVTKKGSVVDNLLVNLGVRGNSAKNSKAKNFGTLISKIHIYLLHMSTLSIHFGIWLVFQDFETMHKDAYNAMQIRKYIAQINSLKIYYDDSYWYWLMWNSNSPINYRLHLYYFVH